MSSHQRPGRPGSTWAALCALGLAGAVVFPAPALAGEGDAGDRPSVDVTGGGCQPRSLVLFTSQGHSAGSTTSDHLGNFASQAELPPGANPRRPEITVTCGPVAIAVRVEVAGSTESDSAGLALAGAAAGLAVAATGLVFVVRRRGKDENPSAAAKEAA